MNIHLSDGITTAVAVRKHFTRLQIWWKSIIHFVFHFLWFLLRLCLVHLMRRCRMKIKVNNEIPLGCHLSLSCVLVRRSGFVFFFRCMMHIYCDNLSLYYCGSCLVICIFVSYSWFCGAHFIPDDYDRCLKLCVCVGWTNRYEITMKVQKLKMSSKYISRICVHNDTERFKNMTQEINGFMKLRHCQSKMPFALLKNTNELTTKEQKFHKWINIRFTGHSESDHKF